MDLAVWLSGMGKLVAHWLSSAKKEYAPSDLAVWLMTQQAR